MLTTDEGSSATRFRGLSVPSAKQIMSGPLEALCVLVLDLSALGLLDGDAVPQSANANSPPSSSHLKPCRLQAPRSGGLGSRVTKQRSREPIKSCRAGCGLNDFRPAVPDDCGELGMQVPGSSVLLRGCVFVFCPSLVLFTVRGGSDAPRRAEHRLPRPAALPLYYTQYTPPFGTFLCRKSKAPLLSQRRRAREYISGLCD